MQKYLQSCGHILYLNYYRHKIVDKLSEILPKNISVLDFGCDDGRLSAELLKKRPDLKLTGVDIQEHRESHIENKFVYDGKNLPFKDETFDYAFSSDVLHHSPDILQNLKELKRVVKMGIIIKDHIYTNEFTKFWVSVGDWCFNMQFDIHCHFNFLKLEEWLTLFEHINLLNMNNPFKVAKIYYCEKIVGKKLNPFFVIYK